MPGATFSRVTVNGSVGGGPEWFEVRRKDGVTYEYGKTNDSRILTLGSSTARLWAVSAIQDPAGNRIEFVYINDTANGSYRPDEIGVSPPRPQPCVSLWNGHDQRED
jgi:hypothetical protein